MEPFPERMSGVEADCLQAFSVPFRLLTVVLVKPNGKSGG
jgi:hypothetical protein